MGTLTSEHYVQTMPVTVFARVGKVDSNTYVGSSKVIGTLWAALDLVPGDEIHSLPGGLYAVTDDGVWSILLTLKDQKHPFEHRFIPPRTPVVPGVRTTNPRKVDYQQARAWENSDTMPLPDALATTTGIGTGLDWVLNNPT